MTAPSHRFCHCGGAPCTMQQCPCRLGGNQATILIILLLLAPSISCNNHYPIMVLTHAISTAAKSPKHRATKVAKISHRQLCPHQNSGSPQGNSTNLHIAKINLTHLRFTNALMTLGTQDVTSSPDSTPTNPLDGTDNPSPPMEELPDPALCAAGTPVGTGAVCINESPPPNHPSNPNTHTQSANPPHPSYSSRPMPSNHS
jgi:hypothetical protein